MKTLRILALFLLLVLPAAGVRGQGFEFPSNPTVGQEVTSPGGTYRWDGDKWVPVRGPAGLPVNNPVFTGSILGRNAGNFTVPPSGTLTLPDTSTWTNTGLTFYLPSAAPVSVLFMGHSSIGASNATIALYQGTYRNSAGQHIANSTSATVITQSSTHIGLLADTGLTVGNGFAPIFRATFSRAAATFNVPLELNTVTYNSPSWDLTRDIDGMQRIGVTNLSGGANAQAAFNLRNNAGLDTWLVQEGSGFVNKGDHYQRPNSSGFLAAGNFFITSGGTIDYWNANRKTTSFDLYGLRALTRTDPLRSQIFLDAPGQTAVWASHCSAGADNLNIVAGGYYDSGVWWTNTPTAQLINLIDQNHIGFYLMHGLTDHAPWVRNAYFATNALYLWEQQNGAPYGMTVSGSSYNHSLPWNGRPPVDAVNVQLWLGNGTCTPISNVSGVAIFTEHIYSGASGITTMGGGTVGVMRSSNPPGGIWTSNSQSPYGSCSDYMASRIHVCYSGGWYWACNWMGADTIMSMMMFETRPTV